MSKFHITSLWRGPRGHLKSIEAPPPSAKNKQSLQSAAFLCSDENIAASCALEFEEQKFQFDVTATEKTKAVPTKTNNTINNVEFIPTLSFISKKPLPDSISKDKNENENQQIPGKSKCAKNEESDDLEDQSSTKTFVIDRVKIDTNSQNLESDDTSEDCKEYFLLNNLKSDSEQSNDNNSCKNTSESEYSLGLEVENHASQTQTEQPTNLESDHNTSLDLEELIQRLCEAQEFVEQHFSLSSCFDEPTSSISIEMASYGTSKTNLTNTTITTATTTAVTTTEASRSTNSSSKTSSGEHSIEEEIEEDIEISEELEDSGKHSELESAKLKVFASTSKAAFAKINATENLFGIDDSEDSDQPVVAQRKNSTLQTLQSSDDDQFKIDDDQLSGEKIAQHFVLDDDDEGDDEDNNVQIVANKGIKQIHSRHNSSLSEGVGMEKHTKQTDESTTDDVSDFLEEVDNEDDDDENNELTIDEIDPPLPADLSNDEIAEKPTSSSPEHSEKNNSVDELLVTNYSIEHEFNETPLTKAEKLKNVWSESSSIKQEYETKVESNAKLFGIITETMLIIDNDKLKKVGDEGTKNIQAESPTATIQVSESRKVETEQDLKVCNEDNYENNLKSDKYNERQENFNKQYLNEISLTETKSKHFVELTNAQSRSCEKAQTPPQENVQIAESDESQSALEILAKSSVGTLDTREDLQENSSENKVITDLDESNETEEENRKEENSRIQFEELTTSFTDHSQDENNDAEGDDDEDDDNSLELLKLRILAMQYQQQQQTKEQTSPTPEISTSANITDIATKPMERVPLTDFSKDVLEDITEESERNSLSNTTNNPDDTNLETEDTSQSAEKSVSKAIESVATGSVSASATNTTSIISLNMFKILEQRVEDLQELVASKDACLASLNLQLETNNMALQHRERQLQQRRDSNGNNNNGSQPCSGRETSSITTNSTEYRTLQEDIGTTTDFYMELSKRDQMIAKLTESLQQSLSSREQLQLDSERLNNEIQLLRKQLNDAAVDGQRRGVCWPRVDQESNGGQRISEISMDLVSESDDDLERNFLTDNEDKFSRNSRERQLSLPRSEASELDLIGMVPSDISIFSKQIEQFQKYLTPSEVRLFFMVQKKFEDFLCQELEKCRSKSENEFKITLDPLVTEKNELAAEIQRLQQAQQERVALHAKEMEDLRKYFETKCAELEKQYSDDVFSQKSRLGANSSSSECSSDAEHQMPEEIAVHALSTSLLGNLVSSTTGSPHARSKESSPRKRTRAELLLSPSHRQMTPGGDGFGGELKESNVVSELKSFYQHKMQELQRNYDTQLQKLSEKIKYFESRYPEDDFMGQKAAAAASCSSRETLDRIIESDQLQLTGTTDTTTDSQISTAQQKSANASLIIIDQDELNTNNESQIIQKIVEEYEKRLQEQILLARQDIVLELERQIQNLLSETTTDDLHWPPELILLREKLTAKSQLEIAQLQMKHEEEMSRLKQDFEKQKLLQRQKNMRRSIYEMGHDTLLAQVCSERDQLRQLLKSFHQALSGLAKCVEGCEDDVNATLNEQAQRLLLNTFLDEQIEQAQDLQPNISGSIFNSSMNTTANSRRMRLLPDLQSLREVVDSPTLFEFIHSKGDDNELAEKLDLKECVERLNEEANYLLQMSERRKQSSHEEKTDDGCDLLASVQKMTPTAQMSQNQQTQRCLRAGSFSENILDNGDSIQHFVHALNSMPADFHYLYNNNNETGPESTITAPGQNSPLVVMAEIEKLKKRLIESETDRRKLQDKLESTISRNTELGQELKSLRDRISQLNSLNHTEYVEGFGLAAVKTPIRKNSTTDATNLAVENYAQLQERARQILYSPNAAHNSQSEQEGGGDETNAHNTHNFTMILLQMIEDFCRESDRIIESNKQERDDLQAKIDAADKQLKAERKFIKELTVEREQDEREREELTNEVERLKREKEKESQNFEEKSRELEQALVQLDAQKEEITKLTKERDASINKIFDLREMIAELEEDIKKREHYEHVFTIENKELKTIIDHQTHSNAALQNEVLSLRSEIDVSYQERIRLLEQKLQNIRSIPEQNDIMEQVVEQLRDIESALDQKTKTLESLHHSISSNSCSHSATEDVSAHGAASSLPAPTQNSQEQQPDGSPVHPSPRHHSLTMEGVQRISEKLAKHTRVEEAALKRIRDLEMQVSQMCAACVELQQERKSLQERMSEQSQRISALQTRLDEQRQRAEDLQRVGTSDLNIRIHDLQSEVRDLNEKLSVRDKQMTSLKQQLEQSKNIILRLEAELAVRQQPDRSTIERLEQELTQNQQEIQKLKNTIKNEMINKQHLPDLMETMLADKNDEIDLLKEQFELKLKEMRAELKMNSSRSSSLLSNRNEDAEEQVVSKDKDGDRDEHSAKHSARTLSDIVSIAEYDEPDVLRRAAAANANQTTPFSLINRSIETSKEAVANLTGKRTEDLTGFSQLPSANTFDNPRYFHDAPLSLKSNLLSSIGAAPTPPQFQPRQINFSDLTDDSKLKTPTKNIELEAHLKSLEQELESARAQLTDMKAQLTENDYAVVKLNDASARLAAEQAKIAQLKAENEQLLQTRESQTELLTKRDKDLQNMRENEQTWVQRLKDLESELLNVQENATLEKAKLNEELKLVKETHANCNHDAEMRKLDNEQLNIQLKAKEERVQELCTHIANSNEQITLLQTRLEGLEQELERLRLQLNSENSSKLFSVEEIAQQVEKELNYSAQLDSEILKAIESEEENNLDLVHLDKANQTSQALETEQRIESNDEIAAQQGTDDENFTGERELLNQIEALRAQIITERERNETMRRELLAEKQHSQDVQEQDIAVLAALRMRLQKAIEQEDDLHKQLDLERERYECLSAQYTALQRAESRRNSAMLLKSPADSPRKSAINAGERTTRSLGDFESDLAERLRSEIKLLTAQNERERERNTDLQRSCQREFERYKNELSERKEYCEQLNKEMHKLQREKENALQECEHLQERLTLQSKEIESLEWRLAALQEAETQRATRRERYQKESTQLLAEVQELKTQALTTETERAANLKLITQLRYDLERSNERERKLVEALTLARESYAAVNSEEQVPIKLLQNEIEVKRQMAETLQLLTEERCQLQQKCTELEQQLGNHATVQELEERCKQLLGRFLRIESHRKALAYQKHYLKVRLQSYEVGERYFSVMHGIVETEDPDTDKKRKKKLFRTVAIAAIAIHRMKYIVNIWRSGKRIVSKSTFTITQQKRSPIQTIAIPSSTAIASTATATIPSAATLPTQNQIIMMPNSPRLLNINEGLIPFSSASTNNTNNNNSANALFNNGNSNNNKNNKHNTNNNNNNNSSRNTNAMNNAKMKLLS